MVRHAVRTALIVGLAIAAAGCGANTTPRATGSTNPSISPPDVATLLPFGAPSLGAAGPADPPASSSPGASADVAGPSPSPIELPWQSTLAVDATITPACVLRGHAATIVVHTHAKNAVAYNAVYAGTKSGAAPPYGHGYGGNDKGYANVDGVYQSTWVVSPQTPVGPARADVIVGDGEAWGYDNPDFAVAGPDGRC